VSERPSLGPGHDHRAARAALEAAGWREIARGDWAHVLRSPDGAEVARVAAIDPAYRVHAEDCLLHAESPWLPRVHEVVPLAACGYVVYEELLGPADEAAVRELSVALDAPRRGDPAPSPAELERARERLAADAGLRELRWLLQRNCRQGAECLGFFGGTDLRPANVLADASGQLKLVDPYFVAGPKLLAALRDDPDAALAGYPVTQLAAFLEIAVFEAERELPGPDLRHLRERVAQLAARPRPAPPPRRTLLETERLRLRAVDAADLDDLFRMDADPEVMRYVNRCFPNPWKRIENEILKRLVETPGVGGLPGFLAAEDREGRWVGWLHLLVRDGDPSDLPELGYRLARDAWGRGLAGEGARALVAHALARPEVRGVTATTLVRNRGSARVLEKAGLQREETFTYTPERTPGWHERERRGVRYTRWRDA